MYDVQATTSKHNPKKRSVTVPNLHHGKMKMDTSNKKKFLINVCNVCEVTEKWRKNGVGSNRCTRRGRLVIKIETRSTRTHEATMRLPHWPPVQSQWLCCSCFVGTPSPARSVTGKTCLVRCQMRSLPCSRAELRVVTSKKHAICTTTVRRLTRQCFVRQIICVKPQCVLRAMCRRLLGRVRAEDFRCRSCPPALPGTRSCCGPGRHRVMAELFSHPTLGMRREPSP